MADDLPPLAPQEPDEAEQKIQSELEKRIAALELQRELGNLSAEGKVRQLLVSEVTQRIRIRWITIALAIAVMMFMAAVLMHAVHSYLLGPFLMVPQTLAIAMFLGPVVSITAITVMLAIGAFRRFRDEDIGPSGAATLAAEGAKSLLGNS